MQQGKNFNKKKQEDGDNDEASMDELPFVGGGLQRKNNNNNANVHPHQRSAPPPPPPPPAAVASGRGERVLVRAAYQQQHQQQQNVEEEEGETVNSTTSAESSGGVLEEDDDDDNVAESKHTFEQKLKRLNEMMEGAEYYTETLGRTTLLRAGNIRDAMEILFGILAPENEGEEEEEEEEEDEDDDNDDNASVKVQINSKRKESVDELDSYEEEEEEEKVEDRSHRGNKTSNNKSKPAMANKIPPIPPPPISNNNNNNNSKKEEREKKKMIQVLEQESSSSSAGSSSGEETDEYEFSKDLDNEESTTLQEKIIQYMESTKALEEACEELRYRLFYGDGQIVFLNGCAITWALKQKLGEDSGALFSSKVFHTYLHDVLCKVNQVMLEQEINNNPSNSFYAAKVVENSIVIAVTLLDNELGQHKFLEIIADAMDFNAYVLWKNTTNETILSLKKLIKTNTALWANVMVDRFKALPQDVWPGVEVCYLCLKIARLGGKPDLHWVGMVKLIMLHLSKVNVPLKNDKLFSKLYEELKSFYKLGGGGENIMMFFEFWFNNLAMRMLKTNILEQRLFALSQFEKLFDDLRSFPNVQCLLELFEKNSFFPVLFDENGLLHSEIISRSSRVLAFLVKNQAMNHEHLQMIWNISTTQHESITNVVFGLIRDLIFVFLKANFENNVKEVSLFFESLIQQGVNKNNISLTIEFCTIFTQSCNSVEEHSRLLCANWVAYHSLMRLYWVLLNSDLILDDTHFNNQLGLFMNWFEKTNNNVTNKNKYVMTYLDLAVEDIVNNKKSDEFMKRKPLVLYKLLKKLPSEAVPGVLQSLNSIYKLTSYIYTILYVNVELVVLLTKTTTNHYDNIREIFMFFHKNNNTHAEAFQFLIQILLTSNKTLDLDTARKIFLDLLCSDLFEKEKYFNVKWFDCFIAYADSLIKEEEGEDDNNNNMIKKKKSEVLWDLAMSLNCNNAIDLLAINKLVVEKSFDGNDFERRVLPFIISYLKSSSPSSISKSLEILKKFAEFFGPVTMNWETETIIHHAVASQHFFAMDVPKQSIVTAKFSIFDEKTGSEVITLEYPIHAKMIAKTTLDLVKREYCNKQSQVGEDVEAFDLISKDGDVTDQMYYGFICHWADARKRIPHFNLLRVVRSKKTASENKIIPPRIVIGKSQELYEILMRILSVKNGSNFAMENIQMEILHCLQIFPTFQCVLSALRACETKPQWEALFGHGSAMEKQYLITSLQCLMNSASSSFSFSSPGDGNSSSSSSSENNNFIREFVENGGLSALCTSLLVGSESDLVASAMKICNQFSKNIFENQELTVHYFKAFARVLQQQQSNEFLETIHMLVENLALLTAQEWCLPQNQKKLEFILNQTIEQDVMPVLLRFTLHGNDFLEFRQHCEQVIKALCFASNEFQRKIVVCLLDLFQKASGASSPPLNFLFFSMFTALLRKNSATKATSLLLLDSELEICFTLCWGLIQPTSFLLLPNSLNVIPMFFVFYVELLKVNSSLALQYFVETKKSMGLLIQLVLQNFLLPKTGEESNNNNMCILLDINGDEQQQLLKSVFTFVNYFVVESNDFPECRDALIVELEAILRLDFVKLNTFNFDAATQAKGRNHVGLVNQGSTCYLNSLIQQLYFFPGMSKLILETEEEEEEKEKELVVDGSGNNNNNKSNAGEEEDVFLQIQKVFTYLKFSRKKFYDPKQLVESCKSLRLSNSVYHQNDVRDLADKLLDRLEGALKKKKNNNQLNDSCFGGKVIRQNIKIGCPHTATERAEEFIALELQIKGKTHVEQSLQEFVQGERLDGENKVLCAECQTKYPTILQNFLDDNLPKLLILHLKRFELDYDTFETVKLNDNCKFPLMLDMFPYTRKAIASKEEEKPKPPDQHHHSQREMYSLSGILIHQGLAGGGHYYSLVKDRSTGLWYRFNDERVSDFHPKDIAEECFGGSKLDDSTNAYMLFYDKEEMIGRVGEGNNKNPPPPPPPIAKKTPPPPPPPSLSSSIVNEVMQENYKLALQAILSSTDLAVVMQNMLLCTARSEFSPRLVKCCIDLILNWGLKSANAECLQRWTLVLNGSLQHHDEMGGNVLMEGLLSNMGEIFFKCRRSAMRKTYFSLCAHLLPSCSEAIKAEFAKRLTKLFIHPASPSLKNMGHFGDVVCGLKEILFREDGEMLRVFREDSSEGNGGVVSLIHFLLMDLSPFNNNNSNNHNVIEISDDVVTMVQATTNTNNNNNNNATPSSPCLPIYSCTWKSIITHWFSGGNITEQMLRFAMGCFHTLLEVIAKLIFPLDDLPESVLNLLVTDLSLPLYERLVVSSILPCKPYVFSPYFVRLLQLGLISPSQLLADLATTGIFPVKAPDFYKACGVDDLFFYQFDDHMVDSFTKLMVDVLMEPLPEQAELISTFVYKILLPILETPLKKIFSSCVGTGGGGAGEEEEKPNRMGDNVLNRVSNQESFMLLRCHRLITYCLFAKIPGFENILQVVTQTQEVTRGKGKSDLTRLVYFLVGKQSVSSHHGGSFVGTESGLKNHAIKEDFMETIAPYFSICDELNVDMFIFKNKKTTTSQMEGQTTTAPTTIFGSLYLFDNQVSYSTTCMFMNQTPITTPSRIVQVNVQMSGHFAASISGVEKKIHNFRVFVVEARPAEKKIRCLSTREEEEEEVPNRAMAGEGEEEKEREDFQLFDRVLISRSYYFVNHQNNINHHNKRMRRENVVINMVDSSGGGSSEGEEGGGSLHKSQPVSQHHGVIIGIQNDHYVVRMDSETTEAAETCPTQLETWDFTNTAQYNESVVLQVRKDFLKHSALDLCTVDFPYKVIRASPLFPLDVLHHQCVQSAPLDLLVNAGEKIGICIMDGDNQQMCFAWNRPQAFDKQQFGYYYYCTKRDLSEGSILGGGEEENKIFCEPENIRPGFNFVLQSL